MVAAAALLADAGARTLMENPIDTVVNLTAFGVLCLLVLHVFRHTIPRLATHFETAITTISSTFRDEAREQRTVFKEEAREQRQVFTEQLQSQRQDFKEFLIHQDAQIEKLADAVHELTSKIDERLVQ